MHTPSVAKWQEPPHRRLCLILRLGDSEPLELFLALVLVAWGVVILAPYWPPWGLPIGAAQDRIWVPGGITNSLITGHLFLGTGALHIASVLWAPACRFRFLALALGTGMALLLGTGQFRFWGFSARLLTGVLIAAGYAWCSWRQASIAAAVRNGTRTEGP